MIRTGQGEQAVSVAEGLLNKKVKVESRAIDEMKDENAEFDLEI